LPSGCFGVQLDGISSRLGFKADSGEREPHLAASVEAERDLVAKPVAESARTGVGVVTRKSTGLP